MQLSLLDYSLWGLSFVGYLAVVAVLLFYKRWKQFPVFTLWMGFFIVQSVVLFFISRLGNRHSYDAAYWSLFVIDILLQLALIVEMARIVLRPTGTWVHDARMTFISLGIAGAAIALGLSYVVKPHAQAGYGEWGVRAYLFTSLLFCELFFAMMFSAQKLGLVWRNHVMGLGQGLMVWALTSALVDTAHSYFTASSRPVFSMLEHIRTIAWIGATIYWIIIFWLPEPERRPLSPEMQKYLIALHQKVQYDASQVSSAPNSR